jgi:hypothetical protein
LFLQVDNRAPPRAPRRGPHFGDARRAADGRRPGYRSGVALGRGVIEVRFTSVPEALQQLFTLAQAITNDHDRFVAIVGGPPRDGQGSPRHE